MMFDVQACHEMPISQQTSRRLEPQVEIRRDPPGGHWKVQTAPGGAPRIPQGPPKDPLRLPETPQRLPQTPRKTPRDPQTSPKAPRDAPRGPQALPERPPRDPSTQISLVLELKNIKNEIEMGTKRGVQMGAEIDAFFCLPVPKTPERSINKLRKLRLYKKS